MADTHGIGRTCPELIDVLSEFDFLSKVQEIYKENCISDAHVLCF